MGNYSWNCCNQEKSVVNTPEDYSFYIDDNWKKNTVLSFSSEYKTFNQTSYPGSFLLSETQPKIDFVNNENRILHCSAILGNTQIVEIPKYFESSEN